MAILLYCIDIVAIGNKYDDNDELLDSYMYVHFAAVHVRVCVTSSDP